MQLILFTLVVAFVVAIVGIIISVLMWVYSIVQYHRDAWYAARYGRPVLWPFSRWRK